VLVVQFDAKHRAGQDRGDRAFQLDGLLGTHTPDRNVVCGRRLSIWFAL
jgi:hypothetical protein